MTSRFDPSRFDAWVRATLTPRHEVTARPGEIRSIIAGLRPAHRRRHRLAVTAGTAVVVIAVVLLMNPGKTGSDGGLWEVTRTFPDGRLGIQLPMTGEVTTVKSLDEVEKWNQIQERAVLGEQEIVEYGFLRYKKKTSWSVWFRQIEAGDEIHNREPVYKPESNLSVKSIRKILPYIAQLEEGMLAGTAIPCPPERHVIDGVPVDFAVWAIDVPGIGRIESGTGLPPSR